MKITESDFDIVFDGILAKNRLAVFAATLFKEGDDIAPWRMAHASAKQIQGVCKRFNIVDYGGLVIDYLDSGDLKGITMNCVNFERTIEELLTDSEYRDNQPSFLDTFFNQSTL